MAEAEASGRDVTPRSGSGTRRRGEAGVVPLGSFGNAVIGTERDADTFDPAVTDR
jgi:hypothetical protein